VVHPSFSALFGISEKLLPRADEEISGDGVPSVFAVFLAMCETPYFMIAYNNEV